MPQTADSQGLSKNVQDSHYHILAIATSSLSSCSIYFSSSFLL